MAELSARRDAYRATVVYRLGSAAGAGLAPPPSLLQRTSWGQRRVGMGAERVQTVLDGFLSCGTSEARSIRSKLGENISANGTACAVSVQEAVIRTYRIGALDVTGAEVQVQVTARC